MEPTHDFGSGASKIKYYHHLKALDDCLANGLEGELTQSLEASTLVVMRLRMFAHKHTSPFLWY